MNTFLTKALRFTPEWRQIAKSLQDKEYRTVFVSEQVDTGLPFQIVATRKRRRWSQQDLADRTGMTQATVSRLESPSYSRFTLSTLKRLAAAFDVGLIVRFVPFSEMVDREANLSQHSLAVPSFDEDLPLHTDHEYIHELFATTFQSQYAGEVSGHASPRLSLESWVRLRSDTAFKQMDVKLENVSTAISYTPTLAKSFETVANAT